MHWSEELLFQTQTVFYGEVYFLSLQYLDNRQKKNCLALTPMGAVVLWDCFWKNVSRSASKSKSTDTLCQQKSTRKGLKYSGKCLGFRTKDFLYGTPDRGCVCECFNKTISITSKTSTQSWREAVVSKSRLV